jgi:energy-coupling factor transporter transmembrane protein EcfT
LHPVIRLACFLLLVAGLAVASKTFLVVVVPLFLLLFKAYCTFSSVLPLLKRLRWLFLSLLILNLWFQSATFTWLPDTAGLLLAMERIGALIIIVLAAHLLISTTPTPEIIAALQWWFIPLNKIIGFSSEKLAVRLALILDTVQTVQNLYTDTPFTPTKNPIKKISERVAGLFAQVLKHAETTPLRTLEISKFQSPPLWQWCYPLLIVVFIII